EDILRYDFTPWFYVALRGEWFRDDDGVRTGTAQDLYAVTFTPTFKVTDNVVIRPEVRADFSEENVFEDDDGAFNEDTQVTGAVNAIFYF
ncbi:MAG TPA: outer membrane beta-barrel protein, partial [Gammaproteobacteria bacterium]|nr:outer membrane beta-barrel protein [Gammaproteobacteria bacterium]